MAFQDHLPALHPPTASSAPDVALPLRALPLDLPAQRKPPPVPPVSPVSYGAGPGPGAVPVTTFGAVPPRQYGDPIGKARSVALFVCLGIVAFAVISGFATVLVLRFRASERAREVPPIAKPIDTVPPPIDTVLAPSEAPKEPAEARLASVRKGALQGRPYWVVLYENTGKAPIGNASVRVSTFDAGGRRLDEATGYAIHKNLAPGASTPVLVLGNAVSGAAKTDIAAVAPEPPSAYDASQLEMTVTDFTERADRYRTDIVGTVRNPTQVPVQFVRVVATGLDAQGQAIAYADTFASLKTIPPGATSGFTISAGTFQVTKPASYRLFSLAMPIR